MPVTTLKQMMCNKQVYPSWAKALRTIKTIRRFRHEALHPYHCDCCQKIHIGHPNEQFERGRKWQSYKPPSREKLLADFRKVEALLATAQTVTAD